MFNTRFVAVLAKSSQRAQLTAGPRWSRRAFSTELMRNIAIIAHVDHGKTTLVDGLLKQSNTGISEDLDRVMDNNAIEMERGITIMSKVTSIKYEPEGGKQYHVNIVDTPGHADFGGEVERIMSMVDGVALIVDASEGPMTQTKFVLGKALKRGLNPIVVFNKVDRDTARVGEVETEVFDLFDELGANDEQLDFPIIYASGRDRWASMDPEVKGVDLKPMYQLIVDHVPPPVAHLDQPFSMLVTSIHSEPFIGKCLRGRITSGTVKVGDNIKALDPSGAVLEEVRVTKLISQVGLQQVYVDSAEGGHIVSVAGFRKASVNHTLCNAAITEPIEHIPIDPPTVCMTFGNNDSPTVGQEGNAATGAMIKEWLLKEAETNVSLVIKSEDDGSGQEVCRVYGRGELQLGIVLENMRRQGFELCVSAPQVVMKKAEDGVTLLEPMEEVVIECHADYQGIVIDKLMERKADMVDLQTIGDRIKVVFHVCTRGLIGYRMEFLNDTRGTGVLNHLFHAYVDYRGTIERSMDKKGAMISTASGDATSYAIEGLQSRGVFFIKPTDKVYPGMVIGEHNKAEDVEVNPVKAKHLTNIRAAGKDDKSNLVPPIVKSLEQMIASVRDDEVIEVTTKSFRLRKKALDPTERKRLKQQKKKLATIN